MTSKLAEVLSLISTVKRFIREFKLIYFAFLIGVFFQSSIVFGENRDRDFVSFSGFYSHYKLRGEADAGIQWPSHSADVELSVRLISIFSLVGSLSNSIAPEGVSSGYSLYRYRAERIGLKVDLPGFFFIGSSVKDFTRSGKFHPLNLFAIAESVNLEMKNVNSPDTTTASGRTVGLGIDIFPFTKLSHFTIRYQYFNYASTSYAVLGSGGGITF